MTYLKTRHFVIIAITILAAFAMHSDIPLMELKEVFAGLGILAATDKVNAMSQERKKESTA